jgi:hypothetical protein
MSQYLSIIIKLIWSKSGQFRCVIGSNKCWGDIPQHFFVGEKREVIRFILTIFLASKVSLLVLSIHIIDNAKSLKTV